MRLEIARHSDILPMGEIVLLRRSRTCNLVAEVSDVTLVDEEPVSTATALPFSDGLIVDASPVRKLRTRGAICQT